jgi:phenylpropionate dioxygenase-like ring-hydroxylating dioxygenase large terminal subunit
LFPVSELVNRDASLVSRRCWTDQGVYELEKRGIFGRAWLFLGHESQIRQPGDPSSSDFPRA